MQEAGFVNVLRTILIILLVYYALKIIARYVFPIFVKKMMGNVEKKFREQQHQNTPHETHIKEGETVIDKSPNARSKGNDDVGDYIDYEEVE